jgi:hypothetical protein
LRRSRNNVQHNSGRLSIIRPVEQEHAIEIASMIKTLSEDGAIPIPANIEFFQKLFVFDSYKVSSELSRGFSLGFDTFKEKVKSDPYCNFSDKRAARIGRISLKGPRDNPDSEIWMNLECLEVLAERVSYFGKLDENGIPMRKKMKKPGPLEVRLGSYDVSRKHRRSFPKDEIEEALNTSLSNLSLTKIIDEESVTTITLIDSIVEHLHPRNSGSR